MDDYIALAIPKCQDKLHHVTNAIMTGIHDVFPPDKNDKIPIYRVDTHSIRSGGANALSLAGYSDREKKMG